MNLLIVFGHPRTASLSGALASAFGEGVRKIGADMRQLDLATLEFDPHVRTESPGDQALEGDPRKARDLILWAEHLVVAYPTWWGNTPVLLKEFLDHVLTAGFSFVTCEGGTRYQGLLNGRSAQLIPTMDTPPLIHRFVYRHWSQCRGAGDRGFLWHPHRALLGLRLVQKFQFATPSGVAGVGPPSRRATAARPDHVSGKVSAKERHLAMRPSASATCLAPTAQTSPCWRWSWGCWQPVLRWYGGS